METSTPTADQPFTPDLKSRSKLDVLYELAGKMSSGSATPAERQWYRAEKPSHWEDWADPESATDDKAPTEPPTQQPAPNPAFDVTKFDAHALAVTADEHSDRICSTIIGLCEKIEAHSSEIFESKRRELLDAGISPDQAAATAKQLGEAAQTEKRKEIYAANEKNLLKEIALLQQREDTARQYAATFDCINAPSPLNLCDAHDLGSAKRTALMQQLEGLQPAAIKGLAALAMQTGDRTLAACLKNLNDRLPKSDRLISSLDMADKLFGEQARAIHQSYVATRTAVQSAISFLRQLQSGRVDSLAKIERGIARHRAKIANKAIAEAKPSDVIAADSALSKIRAGLDNGLAARA